VDQEEVQFWIPDPGIFEGFFNIATDMAFYTIWLISLRNRIGIHKIMNGQESPN